jgi:carboxylesterase
MVGGAPLVIDRGRARACLLLHGWLGTPADFGELAGELDKAGWDVYAPLHPGHGTWPSNLEGLTGEKTIRSARRHYVELLRRYPRLALVGFSMGGAAATVLAAEAPPADLVLIGPFFGVAYKWYYLLPPRWWSDLASLFISYAKRPARLTRVNRPEGRDELIAYRVFHADAASAVFELCDLARAVDTTRLTMPAMLVYSEQDDVCSPSEMVDFFQSFPSVRRRLLNCGRSNHHVLHDYDRHEAVQQIVDFLGS